MTLGLLWSGSEKDMSVFLVLAELFNQKAQEPWQCFTGEGARFLVPGEGFNSEDVARLREHSVELLTLSADRRSLEENRELQFRGVHMAPHLMAALSPLAKGGAHVKQAVFVIENNDKALQKLLETFLHLDLNQVQVERHLFKTAEETLERTFLHTSEAPYYLLLSAFEEPSNMRAYVEQEHNVFVEWGFSHPFIGALDAPLAPRERTFITREGEWFYCEAKSKTQSIFELIRPTLEAERSQSKRVDIETRFRVPITLENAQPKTPELFVLDQDAFYALEPWVASSSKHELAHISVTRVSFGERELRAHYVLRERERLNAISQGFHIQEVSGSKGYVRVAGCENLYVQCGKEIVPRLRHDELRDFFKLTHYQMVLLGENAGGMFRLEVESLDERPLSSLVDWVCTDKQFLLERMLESSLLSFSKVGATRELKRQKIRPPEKKKPASQTRKPQKRVEPEEIKRKAVNDKGAVLSEDALRAELRVLEEATAHAKSFEKLAWLSIAELNAQLGEHADAIAALVVVGFHCKEEDVTHQLLQHCEARYEGKESELIELALLDEQAPRALYYLGARVLDAIQKQSPIDVDTLTHLTRLFADPQQTIALRMAWMVLRALAQYSDDALMLTRAKEALIGTLNTDGLSLQNDIPRFARTQLALASDDRGGIEGAKQLDVLEGFYDALAMHSSDPYYAFAQAVFALGFARAGATDTARSITNAITNHHAQAQSKSITFAGRVLLKLYEARLSVKSSEEATALWPDLFDQVIDEANAQDRAPALWFSKRSAWLRRNSPAEKKAWIRADAQEMIDDDDVSIDKLHAHLRKVFRGHYYEYEALAILKRTLGKASSLGNDEKCRAVLNVAVSGLHRFASTSYRTRATGMCAEVAALSSSNEQLSLLLSNIVDFASDKKRPPPKELLSAIKPALAGVRRLGLDDEGLDFLDALSQQGAIKDAHHVPMQSALAQAFSNLGDHERANALLQEASVQLFSGRLDYAARDEGGRAYLEALAYWPPEERLAHGLVFIKNLDHFNDAFTVSNHFPTFRLLILEGLIDTISSAETFNDERVQRFIDKEELAIRRVINSDWTLQCS